MMPPPGGGGGAGWARPRDDTAVCARRYDRYAAPREEYAARRALFLQSYRLSTPGRGDEEAEEGEGLRGRLARRFREARVAGRDAVARAASRARGAARWWVVGAVVGRAWRGWIRPRARHHPSLLGCFGHGRRECHYLHG